MHKCANALKEIPDFAQSTAKLIAQEERLETTYRPQIFSAFSKKDVGLHFYFYHFSYF